MNAIRSVFNALGNLAASINGLAGVLDVATGRLRQQLAPDEALLEHDPAGGEGELAGSNGAAKGRRSKVGER